MMRTTFRQKLRNNAAAIAAAATLVLCTTAVLVARRCPGKICKKTPITESIRKNDGYCDLLEIQPYLLDKKGKPLKDAKGRRIPNPHYSKLDCHQTDGECDKAKTVKELKSAAGEPLDLKNVIVVNDNTLKLIDGTKVKLPLENDDSYDCKIAKVRENPCSTESEGTVDWPVKMFEKPDPPQVQRTLKMIQAIKTNPALVKFGYNYPLVMNMFKPTCNVTVPVCNPDVPIECFCPNHKECVPDTCGNGEIDWVTKIFKGRKKKVQEECDYASRKGRNRCKKGTVCSKSCRCVRKYKPPKPICGDNKVNQPHEECDGTDNKACKGRKCKSNCRCESKPPPPPPPPKCGNNQIDPGEQCDPPKSRCGPGKKGTCTDKCQCKMPPPPRKIRSCPSDSTVKTVKSDVRDAIDAASSRIRGKHGADRATKVLVTVKIMVNPSGRLTSYTATSSCAGLCDDKRINTKAVLGKLRVVGRTVTAPKVDCYIRVAQTAR